MPRTRSSSWRGTVTPESRTRWRAASGIDQAAVPRCLLGIEPPARHGVLVLEDPPRVELGGDDGRRPPLAARAKNVIWLHMEGAPPTLDMFDRKPTLDRLHLQKCPDSFLEKERFAFIKGHPLLLEVGRAHV